ncbi:MAG: hypothetical protein IT345_10695 [Trueperaceae bacterium]|nr:hypothetical protein [Trueperaceae bacterium]
MSTPTFKFCIHRTFDDGEAFVGIPDARAFLRAMTIHRWRSTPIWKKMTGGQVEKAIEQAVDDALEDALTMLVDHTVRM